MSSSLIINIKYLIIIILGKYWVHRWYIAKADNFYLQLLIGTAEEQKSYYKNDNKKTLHLILIVHVMSFFKQ